MKTRQSKSFKQFMLDLNPNVRTGIFLQIAKQCHVTPACVRMWVRDDSSPQEWRMQVINNIAKKFDCVVEFTPIKRRHYLEGLEIGRWFVCQFVLQKQQEEIALPLCK